MSGQEGATGSPGAEGTSDGEDLIRFCRCNVFVSEGKWAFRLWTGQDVPEEVLGDHGEALLRVENMLLKLGGHVRDRWAGEVGVDGGHVFRVLTA